MLSILPVLLSGVEFRLKTPTISFKCNTGMLSNIKKYISCKMTRVTVKNYLVFGDPWFLHPFVRHVMSCIFILGRSYTT